MYGKSLQKHPNQIETLVKQVLKQGGEGIQGHDQNQHADGRRDRETDGEDVQLGG